MVNNLQDTNEKQGKLLDSMAADFADIKNPTKKAAKGRKNKPNSLFEKMSLAAHRRVEAVKTGAQLLAETKSPTFN